MQLKFSHVMIYVNDMQRAANWYRDTLGFTVNYIAAPHYASLWNEPMQLRLDLHPDADGTNVGRGSMVYFTAPDLDSAVAALRQRGIVVSDPRRRGDSPRFTEFADSEGNPLGLYETPENSSPRPA